jgi:hypothetical protein
LKKRPTKWKYNILLYIKLIKNAEGLLIKMVAFWNIAPHSLVEVDRRSQVLTASIIGAIFK